MSKAHQHSAGKAGSHLLIELKICYNIGVLQRCVEIKGQSTKAINSGELQKVGLGQDSFALLYYHIKPMEALYPLKESTLYSNE